MLELPTLKIKKLFDDAIVPTKTHSTDSGFDLYIHSFVKYYDHLLNNDPNICDQSLIKLTPGSRVLVNTGISAVVEKGYEIQIRPRSGLALKEGITVLNSPGTIDYSYRGFIGVIIINHSNSIELKKGMKIAQMVVCPVILCDIEIVDDLDITDRGSGGFGSTGV